MEKIKYTTLAKNPELYDGVIKLIEKSFDYKGAHHFDVDFYPLMSPTNHRNCHVLLINNEIAGHVGIKFRELGNSKVKTSAILLGGICLSEKFRAQGYFRDFFSHIINLYKDKSSLMFLWSEKNKLYERFDFIQAGGFIQTGNRIVTKESIKDYTKLSLKEANKEQRRQIKELYNNTYGNFLTFKRNESDWNELFEIKSCDLYLSNNETSYFLTNKGADLGGIIHEITPLNIDTLKNLSEFKLWIPEEFNHHFHRKDIHFSCMLRVNNFIDFSEFVSELSNKEIKIQEINKDLVRFGFKDKVYTSELNEFLEYIFGPNPLSEFKELIPQFYVCGLDSI